MAAFAFSRLRFPGRDVLFFLLLAGLMVPDQVLIIPNYALMRQLGWLDSYQGLIVPLLFSAFGTFLLRQYFLSIPADIQEAATIEGANPFQIYWQIYLPLARPALAAFAFLVILWSWNEFLWALIMTSRTEMQVLSVGHRALPGAVLHEQRAPAGRRQHGDHPGADSVPLLPATARRRDHAQWAQVRWI